MKGFLELLLSVEQVVFRGVLAFMCFHLLRTTWLAYRLRRHPSPLPTAKLPDLLPMVTVQLPLYNEHHVAEEVIRAAAALDWPGDRLEIQVLDDSNDETVQVVDATVASCRRDGGPTITVLRREVRTGYKAGALAKGLQTARGELVAIFDADCWPAPDFLRRTVPHLLADDKIGMVQGRWTFFNRERTLLTKLQALLLQSLMLVEQVVKSRRGRPFQFNGTGGVWRRSCIEDAGGWRDDSIAEDLELSFRALLRRWRFVQLPDVEIQTELPETMAAFRVQQRRWVRGNFQVLRHLGGTIATGSQPLGYRLAMLVHIGRRALLPLLALQSLSLPLTTFGWLTPPLDFSLAGSCVLTAACVLSLALFFAEGQAHARATGPAGLYAPFIVGLSFGLSISYSHSVLAGLFGRRSEFVSTPKYGAKPHAGGPRYRAPIDWWALIEIVAGVGHAFCTFWALRDHFYAQGGLFAFLSLSFFAVGISSLRGVRRGAGRQPGVAPAEQPSAAQIAAS